MSKIINILWHEIKIRGEHIGVPFLIFGFFLVIALAIIPIESALLSTLLALGIALISVGLGFTSIGVSAQSAKRQTELLERMDRNVAELPLLFMGDILTSSAQKAVKDLREKQSKEAAQRRLDEDTQKVGYVRGELFQNDDGGWSIHWGGKYPL